MFKQGSFFLFNLFQKRRNARRSLSRKRRNASILSKRRKERHAGGFRLRVSGVRSHRSGRLIGLRCIIEDSEIGGHRSDGLLGLWFSLRVSGVSSHRSDELNGSVS